MVVETKDAVLVAPKDRVQEVKKLVARLKADGRYEHSLHREVFRPWGSYDSIDNGERFQVKRLMVRPGGVLSLQMHHHRAEHWVVVSGTARITRGEESFPARGEPIDLYPDRRAASHRESRAASPLHIIEVQSGSYLGEDDIVRFEDRYGRQGTQAAETTSLMYSSPPVPLRASLDARVCAVSRPTTSAAAIPDELDETLAYQIGQAYAALRQAAARRGRPRHPRLERARCSTR